MWSSREDEIIFHKINGRIRKLVRVGVAVLECLPNFYSTILLFHSSFVVEHEHHRRSSIRIRFQRVVFTQVTWLIFQVEGDRSNKNATSSNKNLSVSVLA